MRVVGEILGLTGVGVALGVFLLAPAAFIMRHARWARDRRRRRAIPLTDDLIRQVSFYDDQADPRELIGAD